MIDINGVEFLSKEQNRHHPRGAICWHYSRFRMTCDEYDALRARANGCCEICGTPEKETRTRRLVIDHFSGRPACYVRGLVCDRCNSVMSCHDGNKRWGPCSLPWREKAVGYAANSWQTPRKGCASRSSEGQSIDSDHLRRVGQSPQITPAIWHVIESCPWSTPSAQGNVMRYLEGAGCLTPSLASGHEQLQRHGRPSHRRRPPVRH